MIRRENKRLGRFVVYAVMTCVRKVTEKSLALPDWSGEKEAGAPGGEPLEAPFAVMHVQDRWGSRGRSIALAFFRVGDV